MSSSFVPCFTKVERQNSQMATIDAAPRNLTGAPQEGQFAVAKGCYVMYDRVQGAPPWRAAENPALHQPLQQLSFLRVELVLGEHALRLQVMQLLEELRDLFG